MSLIPDYLQDEIDRQKTKKAQTKEYLDSVETDENSSRDEDGRLLVSQYGIPADMWDTWAAAAGYPGAKSDDRAIAAKVAGWAVNTLYEEFGNWAFVAIGWRYGPQTARQFRDIFGDGITSDIVEGVMGKAGSIFMNKVLEQMYANSEPPQAPMRHYFQPGSPAAQVSVTFKNEEALEMRPKHEAGTASPGHVAMGRILDAMSNRVAGGVRGQHEVASPTTAPPAGVTLEAAENIEDDDGNN